MKIKDLFYLLLILSFLYNLSIMGSGCAQIGAPTGGPKDTLPPRLVKATPELFSTRFNTNKIIFTFDEFVTLADLQSNLLVSPLPKNNPVVDYKLKTITVKLKDSLLPNTTYTINFGNAVRDNNEGNPIKNFTYVFSTGNLIDSLSLTGKVIIAETGRADSTLMAILYRNLADTAVKNTRPDYMARLNGDGSFMFTNLSAGTYKVYALKDGDGSKTYNAKTEIFGYADNAVTVSDHTSPVTLYAFAEEKESRTPANTTASKTNNANKKLSYTSSVTAQSQDLLDNFELNFIQPLKTYDQAGIILTDTAFKTIAGVKMNIDSLRKKITLALNWTENTPYRLIIHAAALADSAGNTLAKADTIRFTTKKDSDYGNLLLRFSNLDLAGHPVIQFIQQESVKESFPLIATEWNKKLFRPGEYEIRILLDRNNNGKWDAGNYSKKIQPEKVIALPQKISIRANWDNERDIKL